MPFVLFILVNAALFIRPAEIVPALYSWPIYEVLIVLCLAVSLPQLVEQFRTDALEARPITLCVLGLFLAGLLSHLTHFDLESAEESGITFVKVVLYYLVLVSVVNTPARLRQFLRWLTAFFAVLTLVAVLRFHHIVEIALPPPPPTKEGVRRHGHDNEAFVAERGRDRHTGAEWELNRLRGTGIFQDPNDICLVLVVGTVLCLYWLSQPHLGALRFLSLASLLLFGYALYLTHSRGGFLCLLGALSGLLWALYGWRRSVFIGLAVVPALFLVFAGRMTDLSTGEGTAQQRIQIWSDGLTTMREAPLFGVGMDKFGERAAHNSFLNCFTELGIFGGTLFVGVFYLALWSLYRYNHARAQIYVPDQRDVVPFLLAIVAGYAVGMLSLTHSYFVPTYMVLGLATAYANTTVVLPALPSLRFDARLVQRLVIVSAGFLAASYVFVRVFVRWV